LPDRLDPAALVPPGPPGEPLRVTDARLRRLLGQPQADRSELFEALRRDYPLR
jgi:hypothetical protein